MQISFYKATHFKNLTLGYQNITFLAAWAIASLIITVLLLSPSV